MQICGDMVQLHLVTVLQLLTSGGASTTRGIVQVSKQLSGQAVLKAGPPPVEKPLMLNPADLEKPVCIRLEETDTIWLLCLPGGCINADTEQGKAVEQANNK